MITGRERRDEIRARVSRANEPYVKESIKTSLNNAIEALEEGEFDECERLMRHALELRKLYLC